MSDSSRTEDFLDRVDRLQELTEFTEKCNKQLNEIFETLGWSRDHNKDSSQVVVV